MKTSLYQIDKITQVLKGAVIFTLPLACVFVALFIGRYPVSVPEVLGSLLRWGANCVHTVCGLDVGGVSVPLEGDAAVVYTLVIDTRLPRAIAAACVGGALAVSGAAFQGVFRNPLVNPGLLGVTNGAGFGAALAFVVAGGGVIVYPCAFTFGVLAVACSYAIARVYKRTPIVMLLLGGTVVSGVFSALTSFMKYVADASNQLPSIVYWLMGSLSGVGWPQLLALVPMFVGIFFLWAWGWRIDIISMGDKLARTMGIDVTRDKAIIVAGATLATASAVCIAGVVGWVGLIIPHIGRMIVGSKNSSLIPAAFCIGGAFMVVVDTVARCIIASELPLGTLTAIIGGPFFVYLLKKTKGSNW